MSQGRGNAVRVLSAAALLISLVVVPRQVAQAATYTVGDSGGWTFNTVRWPNGKRFGAGDTLVFNYDPTIHNVVEVNKAGYEACRTPRGARVLSSGRDQVKLTRRMNYFICNFAGHCESGMKIAISAL